MSLYPRFVVEDGRILCKVNVEGVERSCEVGQSLAHQLAIDILKCLQWADCSAPHPSDADYPVPPR